MLYEDDWTFWLTGLPATFTSWLPGEPDNYDGVDYFEMEGCVAITNRTYGQGMMNVHCDWGQPRGVLCEGILGEVHVLVHIVVYYMWHGPQAYV